MSTENKPTRGRKPSPPQQNIYNEMQHVSKTFQVSNMLALEALTAVGTNPEKLADYLKNKKRERKD